MPEFRTVLALDTAMGGCSVSVCRAGYDQGFYKALKMPRGQAEHLVPMIEEVLAEAGVAYSDFDVLVTTVGPGAFTGLRIGLSTAKTLQLVLDVPLFGITTLQALALEYSEKTQGENSFTALVETKREDFYFQIFDYEARPLSEPASATATEVWEAAKQNKASDFIGDACERFQDIIEDTGNALFVEEYDLPDPRVMARALLSNGKNSDLFTQDIEPLYLRAPDVSYPKNKKQQQFQNKS